MRRRKSSKSAGLRRNEQVKKVFWAVFAAVAGMVLTRVLDPATAENVVAMITGMGI